MTYCPPIVRHWTPENGVILNIEPHDALRGYLFNRYGIPIGVPVPLNVRVLVDAAISLTPYPHEAEPVWELAKELLEKAAARMSQKEAA